MPWTARPILNTTEEPTQDLPSKGLTWGTMRCCSDRTGDASGTNKATSNLFIEQMQATYKGEDIYRMSTSIRNARVLTRADRVTQELEW